MGGTRVSARAGQLLRWALPLIAASVLGAACGPEKPATSPPRAIATPAVSSPPVPPTRPTPTAVPWQAPAPREEPVSGAELFQTRCAVCHGVPTDYYRAFTRLDEMTNYAGLTEEQKEKVRDFLRKMSER